MPAIASWLSMGAVTQTAEPSPTDRPSSEQIAGLLSQLQALAATNCHLQSTNSSLESENGQLRHQIEQWKAEAQRLAEVLERLRYEQKTPREHVDPNQIQLAFEKLASDLLKFVPKPEAAQTPNNSRPADKQRKHTPHGRSVLPESLPVDTIVIQPKGLPESAQCIGEDVAWKLAFRRASFRRLKVVRPRFSVPVEDAAQCEADQVQFMPDVSYSAMPSAAVQDAPPQATPDDGPQPNTMVQGSDPVRTTSQDDPSDHPIPTQSKPTRCGETTVVQSNAPRDVIPRGLATVELLASVLTGKFADKLPFNRQQGICERSGVCIGRTVMCQWTEAVSDAVQPLISAMQRDAREHADVIHTDATGILVQDKPRCKKGSFWVYVSDNGHIIFRYTANSSGDEPRKFFAGYKGIVVADATSTLDAIIGTDDGPSDRGGCWAHVRRYFYKALQTERELALIGIGLVNRVLELERPWAGLAPAQRLALRQTHSAPVFAALLDWCTRQLTEAQAGSRLYKALFYFTNNERDLRCFLRDGKVALTNNVSERQLRTLVTGRANWLFIGGDHTGPWTANITSLVGSCSLHGLDPEAYLRDLLRVLPHWPRDRILQLCPRDWLATRARLDPVELALPLGPLTIPPVSG